VAGVRSVVGQLGEGTASFGLVGFVFWYTRLRINDAKVNSLRMGRTADSMVELWPQTLENQ
jgi:hypothetical protein